MMTVGGYVDRRQLNWNRGTPGSPEETSDRRPNLWHSPGPLHCGEANSFPEYESMEFFICDSCGEWVVVDEPIHDVSAPELRLSEGCDP